MSTLVISAPWGKKDNHGNSIGKEGQSHSWETFFQNSKGLGYMLYPSEKEQLKSGETKIVLIRTNKKHERRAEAILVDLIDTKRPAGNGGWRYDVLFQDQQEIKPYKYLMIEKLKRNGVKVIP